MTEENIDTDIEPLASQSSSGAILDLLQAISEVAPPALPVNRLRSPCKWQGSLGSALLFGWCRMRIQLFSGCF